MVLKVRGRLRVCRTGVGEPPTKGFPRLLLVLETVLGGLFYSGMKEGCSGENVLGRER